MTYKIDTDIPTPKGSANGTRRYPFADMPVGGSFFVPGAHTSQLTSAARHYRPKKFTARAVTETDENGNEVRGIRVWRIE